MTVIVPVYNVEKYLHNCIKSVQNQTYKMWELILVDDGSRDKSGEICDDYATKDNRIIVIHKENGGQAQARNMALDVCNGEYVTFLDSDDFLHPGCIEYLVNCATKTNADIVQCDYIRGLDSTFPVIYQRMIEKNYDNHSVFLKEKAKIIVCGKLIRREIVQSNRIKEGKYYEDDYTTWKWYYHANKITVSNKLLYYYTVNPTSTMAQHQRNPSFDFLEAYRERICFFQNKGEADLEHCSRLQLCKSIVLSYGNPILTHEERHMLKASFNDSWRVLKKSPYIRLQYKFLFALFMQIPTMSSKVAAKLHNIKK